MIQILLIISGTVEINTGPHVSKNLSFAVWNLESLPARDFARTPLIQSTYDVDIFGVCESMLIENTSHEDILINGSPLTLSSQIKILIPGMDVFACTLKNTFRLRKDAI